MNLLPGSMRHSPDHPSSLPIFLNTLEYGLICECLHARCHPPSRLLAAGYMLEPSSERNQRPPSKGSVPPYFFRATPPQISIQSGIKRRAVALDCEMVGVANNRQALGFLSAIDFLTGEILINGCVTPSERVVDWRAEFSGLTPWIMDHAIRTGTTLGGWPEARERLLQFVDAETVLIGHSLNYDLAVLGMHHGKVVDSTILTAEAVFHTVLSAEPFSPRWSLKTLSKELLGLNIQSGTGGHNALEDAYAARDVVIWCIKNPEKLKSWAEKARKREEERKAARDRAKIC